MSLLRRLLLSLLSVCGFLFTHGQVIDVSRCDSTSRFPITKFACYLTTTEQITIDSAIANATRFVKSKDEPVLAIEYDPYYYWFRMVLTNPDSHPRDLMLLMAPIGMYEGLLYQEQEGKWVKVAQAGLKYTFEDRSYQFTHHVFPFTLAAKTTDTLYVSIDASNAYKTFGFALIKPKDLKMFENKIYFIFGIIVGLLLLFFILNIALFFALKESLHLWYALYIALLFLIVMKNDHLDQQFLGLDSERAFRLTPYMTIGLLAIAVLMHVVQRFFKTILNKNRPLYVASSLVKMNALASAVIHSIVFMEVTNVGIQSNVFAWAKISILLGVCMIIVECLYCIKKGNKSAYFILFGSFVFMVGSLQRVFLPSTLSFLFPPTTFHVGIILETIVISMGLIYRYWTERETLRQKMEQVEIDTIHEISEELHDNIAQTLGVANINLNLASGGKFTGTAQLDYLKSASKGISEAITDLRNLSRELKGDSEKSAGIEDKVRKEYMKIAELRLFDMDLQVTGKEVELERKKQAYLLRILKEALQNVIKHAEAKNVQVKLTFHPHKLSLRITDDGKGFNAASENLSRNGLLNIAHRCHLLNASYDIETDIGKGTDIYIQMPV